MTNNDAWNLIVEMYKKSKIGLSGQVSSNWESIFCNLLGYSISTKEVVPNSMGGLAVSDFLLDFTVKKSVGDDFFCYVKVGDSNDVVGLKEKLYSAMRYLNLDLGLLVANNSIAICDYTGFVDRGTLEIDIFSDNWAGFRFVELFYRENFDKNTVKQFIKKYKNYKINVADQSQLESRKTARKQSVYNSLSLELIYDLLRAHFSKSVSQEEWNEIRTLFDVQLTKTPTPGFVTNIGNSILENNRLFSSGVEGIKKSVNFSDIGLLSKNDAIALCHKNGIELIGDVVYCSENKTGGFYFVNIHKDMFGVNFVLLLNDRTKRELNVFNILSNSISRSRFAMKDRNTITLQISSRDNLYKDGFSKVLFDKYLAHTFVYSR